MSATRPVPAVRAPQQARSRASTERLLDAALEVLARAGVGGLTIADVSRVAGVSVGSLYHRFGDRDGLLAACQQRFFDRVADEWLTTGTAIAEERDPRALLERIVAAFDEVFGNHRSLFRAFMVTGYDEPTLRAQGIAFSRRTAELMIDLLAERTAAPREAADTVYRMLFGHAILEVMFDDGEVSGAPADRTRRRAHLVTAAAALLSPPDARASPRPVPAATRTAGTDPPSPAARPASRGGSTTC
ncbi:TetR/AcrR family transcriptional regulator [Nocardioides sp. GY 10113]|uniref:TetR/AcrR family transcriptional regulator n=1 Tax=Nocardioides sp. GY 10113 TaxID=2569761 RepID=UPI0010A7930B|nr:TetR/AcrR family transcriptional regulator [Nocardioides sp. GY 10113]TIC88549.1 TetR/AcrR family transcriptional regulator [Nocardioides sp. GY 10113]